MDILCAKDQTKLSAQVIQSDNGHVPIPLQRLPQARLLWLNSDAASEDPVFATVDNDLSRYGKHLLKACAFTVTTDHTSVDTVGVADRYGGDGIGSNGGSGRAAFIGGYHVKGIGRTPLVGLGVDETHASGFAYLEECVRESILAEICARDFPFGSVRTLAIIETGRVQVWQTETGPKPERCCLLIRSAFLRPAHLERAVAFRTANPHEGSVDAERVRRTVHCLANAVGGLGTLQDRLLDSLARWARQLACSYVYCLPHGGVSSSNVCVDGRLVDFGAMAAVPSLARYWVASGVHPSGEEYKDILNTVNSLACTFRFTLGMGETARSWREAAIAGVLSAYGDELHSQALRLLGFDDDERVWLRATANYINVRKLLDGEIAHWRRPSYTIFSGAPWQHAPMPSDARLERLAQRILVATGEALPISLHMSAQAEHGRLAAVVESRRQSNRSRWIMSRPRLDREQLKAECYDRLDGAGLHAPGDQKVIGELITEIVNSQSRCSMNESSTRSAIC
jgi:hypothetical protein